MVGSDLTAFFVDSGPHPGLGSHCHRLVMTSPQASHQWMRAMDATVRELLAAAQATRKRKAKLDAGRVDTVFKMGDQLLQTEELLVSARCRRHR